MKYNKRLKRCVVVCVEVRTMGIDLRQVCKKCNERIESTNMRAAKDGGFLCRSCYQTVGNTTESMPKKHTSSDSFFKLKSYSCEYCNYTFKRNPELRIEKCPFCGKSGRITQMVENPANDLLDDDF